MSIFTSPSRIVITCQSRLSGYLEEEVNALGFSVESRFMTGVVVQGTVMDCIKLNLHLRCASQVQYSLSVFEANHADEVYLHLKSLPWENIIPAGGYFSVTSVVSHYSVRNNMFVNVRVKDAIVDRFREKTGERPSSGSGKEGVVVHLFWKNEQAEVFIDTTGDSIAKHGYRKVPGKAPMLEALAAAVIMATNWDQSAPFVNPMCGAGTLAIEAALIATHRKPGLHRKEYAFKHLQEFNETDYTLEVAALSTMIREVPGLQIIASDHDPEAIRNARINAKAAGVEELLSFQVCDFSETKMPIDQTGIVIMNPEYGERLGEIEELEVTYKLIGDYLKQKCSGYKGYVFTGNLDLAKRIGLKAKRRIEFYNSTIDCRLLEYELYAGSRRETV